MPRIIVLFNLKQGVGAAQYEAWARSTDAPAVKRLAAVQGFSVHRSTQLLGSQSPPPYAYVEVLDVTDIDDLLADLSSETMQKIAAEFQAFADNPQFIVTQDVVR